MRFFWVSMLFIFLHSDFLVAAGSQAVGRENPPVNDGVETVDAYSAQGEYASVISGSGSSAAPIALQVIALGERDLRAYVLTGGLPGNGWDRGDRIRVDGQLNDQGASFHTDECDIQIQGQQAHVQSRSYGWDVMLSKVNRQSPYAGLKAPSRAIVLFDGGDTSGFRQARVRDGLLQVGTEIRPTFRNYHLHIEFLVPFMPRARGQGRGNSGVYLQSRYEVQVLDSFGLEGRFNECGALYRQRPPDLNMAFPPGVWQTYDIAFHAPRFDKCGNKRCDARLTVLHNGVPIHNDVRITDKTGAGKPEGPTPLPIKLQDHGNPVQFRNIWLLELPR